MKNTLAGELITLLGPFVIAIGLPIAAFFVFDIGRMGVAISIMYFVVTIGVALFVTGKIVGKMNEKGLEAQEKPYLLSDEKKRHLFFGAILFFQNNNSINVFFIPTHVFKDDSQRDLANWWGIIGYDEAVFQLERLANANSHTPFSDVMWNKVIKAGFTEPLTIETLRGMVGLQEAYKASQRRLFGSDKNSFETLLTNEQQAVEHDLLNRVNDGIEKYKEVKQMLIKEVGYSEDELLKINTLSAWDFGRTAWIARESTSAGYIQEEEAWSFIKTAADNATKAYSSWREYFAAYVIGRAVAYGDVSRLLTALDQIYGKHGYKIDYTKEIIF